jgi:alpha-beta hydrolase superfamily lysophospholipase
MFEHVLIHQQGGAIVLQYPCVGKDDLKVKHHLRGVVATSPFLRQTNPELALKLAAGHVASKLLPWMLVPAPVDVKVGHRDII